MAERCPATWGDWRCVKVVGHPGQHSELTEVEEAELAREEAEEGLLADMMRKILGRGPDPWVWVTGLNMSIDGNIDLTEDERECAIRLAEKNNQTIVAPGERHLNG